MAYMQHNKPEFAYRKACELIKQDQPKMALKVLQDVIKRRKMVQWSQEHEQIMKKIVELSVDLRLNVREDLFNYQRLCLLPPNSAGQPPPPVNVNDPKVKSIQNVLEHLLGIAEKKASEAAKSTEVKSADMEEDADIDEEQRLNDEAPEAVIMKAVSGEESKDRITREVLTPWLRYLNECYRYSMDICNKPAELEAAFHAIADKAFKFCKEYNQKQSFKTFFCKTLHDHIKLEPTQIERRRKLIEEEPTIFTKMVDTRFLQLDVSVHFDNWQEAYKAMEDIHHMFSIFGKTPPPEMIAQYYKQLARIFFVSNKELFHAYTLLKLFQHQTKNKDEKEGEKERKKDREKRQDPAERQKLASQVVLAVLCIPLWTQRRQTHISPFIDDLESEKAEKMINLLGSQNLPTRQSLLSDIQILAPKGQLTVEQCVHPKVMQLFNLIERNVQPLGMGDQIPELLEFLEEYGFGQYVAPLKKVAAVSVILQASRVFSTLSMKALTQMCSFYESSELEALLVTAARSESCQLGLCIDHQSGSITFVDSDMSPSILSSTLTHLRKRMATVNRMLDATRDLDVCQMNRTLAQQHELLLKRVESLRDDERRSISKRKDIIDKRKFHAEEKQKEIEQARKIRLKEELEQREEQERLRVQEKEKLREKEKQEQEQKEKEAQQVKQIISIVATKTMTNVGAKTTQMLVGLASQEDASREEVMDQGKKLVIEMKEKKEQKLKEEWHKVHWYERACRELEAPLVEENHWKRLQKAKEDFEIRKKNIQERNKKEWEHALATKERLSKMVDEMDAFYEDVLDMRRNDPIILDQAWKDAMSKIREPVKREPAPADLYQPEPVKSKAMEVDNWRSGPSTTQPEPEAAPTSSSGGVAKFKARGPSNPPVKEAASVATAPEPAGGKFRAAGRSWRDGPGTEKEGEGEKKKAGFSMEL